MFLIGEPSAARVSLLIDEQRGAPLSYAEVGASRDAPGKVPGYAVDHNRVRLGDGEEVFVRAAEALYAWKMFDLGWVRLLPRGTPADVGTTVAVLARHIGFRSLNFSRVVYEVSGEEGGVRKLGFAYGTLPEHAERGEERFVVELHPDGPVFYDLYAFSRPNHPLSRLGYPFARGLQRRFARGSLAAMARAVEV
ncbi:MAG TPA: DUF1990 domain-containing protein [Rubrobacter sp.]|nr:DUF1990 domain-containing protein [Rubrobacter sp.]